MNTRVALLMFNRPDTTARVLDALRRVRPRTLFVIADGARPTRTGEAEKCAATRALVETIDWDCEIVKNYADTNLGLKPRIESGLNWLFEQTEEAIIVEDDCVPDPSFFPFCAEMLARYRDEPQVMGISGSNLQLGSYHSPYSYHFSRYPLIWGWATWRRAWQRYDGAMRDWETLRADHWLANKLETSLMVRYWDLLLQKNFETSHTWDYCWLMSVWQHNGLHVLPNVNLVSNIGFRADASHTLNADDPFANLPAAAIEFPLRHPPAVVRDAEADLVTEEKSFSGRGFLKELFLAARKHAQAQR